MADRFRLADSKLVYTPMEPGIAYEKSEKTTEMIDAPYQEACSHILWPAIISRPDVQFAVGIFAQFTHNPEQTHWNGLKRVIKYLHTTRGLWLNIGGCNKEIRFYTDVDWASQTHRHSISGFAFQIGGGSITWSSKKQAVIALSTTEAEYIAATHTAREILWARMFLAEIGRIEEDPTTLYCDNQSATLARDNKFHARTKHININYHFIREAVENGSIEIMYVPTEENLADVFTKALPRVRFEYLAKRLGLRSA